MQDGCSLRILAFPGRTACNFIFSLQGRHCVSEMCVSSTGSDQPLHLTSKRLVNNTLSDLAKCSYFFLDFQIAVTFLFLRARKSFCIHDYLLLEISSNPVRFSRSQIIWGYPSRFTNLILSDCQKSHVFGIIDHSLRTDCFTELCSYITTLSNLRGYPSVLGSEKTARSRGTDPWASATPCST